MHDIEHDVTHMLQVAVGGAIDTQHHGGNLRARVTEHVGKKWRKRQIF